MFRLWDEKFSFRVFTDFLGFMKFWENKTTYSLTFADMRFKWYFLRFHYHRCTFIFVLMMSSAFVKVGDGSTFDRTRSAFGFPGFIVPLIWGINQGPLLIIYRVRYHLERQLFIYLSIYLYIYLSIYLLIFISSINQSSSLDRFISLYISIISWNFLSIYCIVFVQQYPNFCFFYGQHKKGKINRSLGRGYLGKFLSQKSTYQQIFLDFFSLKFFHRSYCFYQWVPRIVYIFQESLFIFSRSAVVQESGHFGLRGLTLNLTFNL